MARALQLLILDVRAVWHRLRHDLGKEIAVLFASLILLATFGYVFNDFLNVQIASLSTGMRDAVARYAAVTVWVAATLGAAKALRRTTFDSASTRAMARTLGELRKVLTRYSLLHATAVILIWHGSAWLLSDKLLLSVRAEVFGAMEALMLALTLISLRLPPPKPQTSRAPRRALAWIQRSPLLTWRLNQHVLRNRSHQLIYGLAMIFVVLGSLALAGGSPLLAPVVSAFVAGTLLASILALSLARDLEHAWIEHALGISHDQMVRAYAHMALVLTLPLAIFAGLLTVLAAPDAEALRAAWKPAAILAVTPLFAPYMLFQIDARRPGINMIALIIIGLFMGTAIFAHGLAILIPFLAKAGIAGNQANRFHRA